MYLEEKIGNPELFTGRKRDFEKIGEWVDKIPRRLSMSSAIVSRRKTGKSAFLQRLYNLIFEKNGDVIPFYYEMEEGSIWRGDFCQEFFMQFVLQYVAFKTRKASYIQSFLNNLTSLKEIIKQENLDYLIPAVENVEINNNNIDNNDNDIRLLQGSQSSNNIGSMTIPGQNSGRQITVGFEYEVQSANPSSTMTTLDSNLHTDLYRAITDHDGDLNPNFSLGDIRLQLLELRAY